MLVQRSKVEGAAILHFEDPETRQRAQRRPTRHFDAVQQTQFDDGGIRCQQTQVTNAVNREPMNAVVADP